MRVSSSLLHGHKIVTLVCTGTFSMYVLPKSKYDELCSSFIFTQLLLCRFSRRTVDLTHVIIITECRSTYSHKYA